MYIDVFVVILQNFIVRFLSALQFMYVLKRNNLILWTILFVPTLDFIYNIFILKLPPFKTLF